MKDFFKFTLATITGLVLSGIVFLVIGIITIFSLMSTADTETVVRKNSVMVLHLNGTLVERTQDDLSTMLTNLLSSDMEEYGLDDIVTSIKKAKENDDIKAIYLNTTYLAAQYASLEAIRNALIDFKESGKPVIAYADNYTQGLYYLASAADKVLLNPLGMLDWKGLASTPIFYKNLLDKVGVEVQVFKVGTYKSAVEPFTATEMSPANREQITAFLGSTWNQLITDVSESRGISKDSLNLLADKMLMLAPAELAVEAGMVDTLVYQNDVNDYIKSIIGLDKDERIRPLDLADMKNVKKNVPKDKSGNIVAVYYASGSIVDQPSTTSEQCIVGSKVIRDLSKLQKDENVKAVVLRVNSPGGSAFASEQIWNAVKELKKEKPVIVSMSDYAASGGYYISCGADTIVAEPTTLTGSIGVFGMFPSFEKISNKVGIDMSVVKTNTYADFGSLMRPLNPGECNLLQGYVNRTYELFINRCAEGRDMSTEAIEKIAEGRIWTGEMALQLGLVDVLGGLQTALDIAVEKADNEDYTVCNFHAKEDFISSLLNKGNSNYIKSEILKSEFGSFYNDLKLLHDMENRAKIQTRVPFELIIK